MTTKPKKTKQRYVCHQDLEAFANRIIRLAKNGDRAVFRTTNPHGDLIEISYVDVPAFSTKHSKMEQDFPQGLWGVYSSKIKPEELVSDLSFKGA